jgi:hypothetical protein
MLIKVVFVHMERRWRHMSFLISGHMLEGGEGELSVLFGCPCIAHIIVCVGCACVDRDVHQKWLERGE